MKVSDPRACHSFQADIRCRKQILAMAKFQLRGMEGCPHGMAIEGLGIKGLTQKLYLSGACSGCPIRDTGAAES